MDGVDSINMNDIDIGSENGDEIDMTPSDVIQIMEEAWVNEKFAPEILPHKSEIVDCLLGQISYMEANLQSLQSTDFKKSIHQMEIDRLRFLVSSYLRIRLEKIETYCLNILKQENQRRERCENLYLTENELNFAKEYSESLGQYFDKILNVHPLLATDDWKAHRITPNLHSFVFLKSKDKIDGVVIDEVNDNNTEYAADFNKGSQLIISYYSISNLVKKGDVQLI